MYNICGERVKTNATAYTTCKVWVHKRCSEVRGALTRVKDVEMWMNVDVVKVSKMMKRK